MHFFFPKDYAPAVNDSATGFADQPSVRRYFYSDRGKDYMLLGVPWSWIDSSPAGDLIIDPTTSVATSADVWLEDLNNKNSTILLIGKAAGFNKKRTLIKFDVAGSGIPTGATVLNARLKLKYYGAVNVGGSPWIDRWVQAHQLLKNWTETEADSSRRERAPDTLWAAPFGALDGTDAKATMESTVLFKQDYPKWQYWNLSNLTKYWLDNPTKNFGVILWATNENTVGYDLRMYSSHTSNPDSIRPKLEVTYFTDAATKTVYFLKDHLGSIRATVLDSATAPVRGYDDYDPWGYPLAGRTKKTPYDSLQKIARNKFTGKEWDDEFGVNWYHFDWRSYDPQIGRLLSVDPQAEDSPSHSPYHYAYNNPLAFNDPTGQSAEAVVEKDSSGNETGNVIVSANLIFYGSQATNQIAAAIVSEIQNLYNTANATITINGKQYTVKFNITSQVVSAGVASMLAKNNTDIKNNFIRVENKGAVIRSQMEVGGNAGFFVTSDNLGQSTTAAHEFGHGLGLLHSPLNQIGQGQPDIMAGRGTRVDPQFQYDPSAQPGAPGGIVNPIFRAVAQKNISDVFVNIHFTNGVAKIGILTNTIFK